MPAPDSHPGRDSGEPALPLERRAGLARETVRLIGDMSASLLADAEEARRRCREAGGPAPMAQQIDALVQQAERLRRQSEQLRRAFFVLDRLVPPGPAAPPAAATRPGQAGDRPQPPPVSGPPPREGRPPARPSPAGGEEDTRAAAAAFAVALKLDGASRDDVEARLVREFGRADARLIADEAFGPNSG